MCALDAVRRTAARTEAHHAETQETLTRWLGTADLALSSSSRWLRHSSQVEPAAAAADAPASLDTDPAGAWLPPRRAWLGQSARDLRRGQGSSPEEGAP
ncbi:MAG: hypothetical protein R3B40_15510 [Polyangiales bacterium]|nr:hypothetical protein [Myxococcales bacterium]MCB9658368.1 hypothetical protein [Sandaracinaceae bacterium]